MIINQTKKKIISASERSAKNILTQARGLMFRKKQNLIMFFKEERTISLHNFFVFFPHTVILLNKNKEIVEIKAGFQPFTTYAPKHQAQYLIELAIPAETAEYEVGDKLEFYGKS